MNFPILDSIYQPQVTIEQCHHRLMIAYLQSSNTQIGHKLSNAITFV